MGAVLKLCGVLLPNENLELRSMREQYFIELKHFSQGLFIHNTQKASAVSARCCIVVFSNFYLSRDGADGKIK